MPSDLPTIEECRAFRDLINLGRDAMGLAELEHLDFDGAVPDESRQCLSAINVFGPAGYYVYTSVLGRRIYSGDHHPEALEAMGMTEPCEEIPSEIRRVTKVFDACVVGSAAHRELRARMVEAGVVAPLSKATVV